MAGTVLKIKQTAVVGRVPTHNTGNNTDIEQGELALNTADKKLYSKDSNGTIFEIGSVARVNLWNQLLEMNQGSNPDDGSEGAILTLDLNERYT